MMLAIAIEDLQSSICPGMLCSILPSAVCRRLWSGFRSRSARPQGLADPCTWWQPCEHFRHPIGSSIILTSRPRGPLSNFSGRPTWYFATACPVLECPHLKSFAPGDLHGESRFGDGCIEIFDFVISLQLGRVEFAPTDGMEPLAAVAIS